MVLGSITTMVTNPIWTVQTAQSTHTTTFRQITNTDTANKPDDNEGAGAGGDRVKKVKPSALAATREIIKIDGVSGLWRGIGPALVLVINPVIQVSCLHPLPLSFFFLGPHI